MTSITSSLNEAEDALVALIQTQAATPGSPLAGVPIQLGHPAGRLKLEHVWVGEQGDAQHTPELTGAPDVGPTRTDNEQLQLKAHIYVQQGGDNFTKLRDRCSALSEEIETALFTDPTMGGAVWDAVVTSIERDSGVLPRGRAAEVVLTIAATQFLS